MTVQQIILIKPLKETNLGVDSYKVPHESGMTAILLRFVLNTSGETRICGERP